MKEIKEYGSLYVKQVKNKIREKKGIATIPFLRLSLDKINALENQQNRVQVNLYSIIHVLLIT